MVHNTIIVSRFWNFCSVNKLNQYYFFLNETQFKYAKKNSISSGVRIVIVLSLFDQIWKKWFICLITLRSIIVHDMEDKLYIHAISI